MGDLTVLRIGAAQSWTFSFVAANGTHTAQVNTMADLERFLGILKSTCHGADAEKSTWLCQCFGMAPNSNESNDYRQCRAMFMCTKRITYQGNVVYTSQRELWELNTEREEGIEALRLAMGA